MGAACCSAGGTVIVHDHDVDWQKRRAVALKKDLLSHVVSGKGDSNPVSDGYLFFAPPTRWHFLAALHRQQRTHDLAAQAQRRRQQRMASQDNTRRADAVSLASRGSGRVVGFADDSKSAVHDYNPSVDTSVEMPADTWCYLVHTSQYVPTIVDPNAPGSSITVDHGQLRSDGTVDASKMRRRSSRRFSKRKSEQGSVSPRNRVDSAVSILDKKEEAPSPHAVNILRDAAAGQAGDEYSDHDGGSTGGSNTMAVRGAGGGGEYLYLADPKLSTTAKKKGASQARLLTYFDGKPLLQNTLTERPHQHINASSDDGGRLGLFVLNGGRFSELAAANQALIRSVSNALWMAAPLHNVVPNTSSDLLLPTTSPNRSDEGDDVAKVVSKGPTTLEKQEKALQSCMSPLDLFLMHPSSYFESAHYEAAVSGRGLYHGPSRVAVGEVPAVALHVNSFAVECQTQQKQQQQQQASATQPALEVPSRRSAVVKRERCGGAARSLLQRALGASMSIEGGGETDTKDLALSCFKKAATARRHHTSEAAHSPSSAIVGSSGYHQQQISLTVVGMRGLVTSLTCTKVDTTTVRPPAVLFTTAGLASTPRHPLAPALTALITTSILPTSIPTVGDMDGWLGSISSSARHQQYHHQRDSNSPSPTTFLSAPVVTDLGSAVHYLWRGTVGTGHNPQNGGDQYHLDDRVTESTRQQSFAATPLSGSIVNAEDMHVPDDDGSPRLPLPLPNNNERARGGTSHVQRLNSDSTTIPHHPPHHHMPLRTFVQSKGTFSLSLGVVSTTYVHLGSRGGGGSSTPPAAYEGGSGWGTPRRQSHHSASSPEESSQWGTPRGGRRRRSLIPRPSTSNLISSPAQDDEGGGVEEAHVTPPIFMAAPTPPTVELHPTNGIDGVSLLLQALTMAKT